MSTEQLWLIVGLPILANAIFTGTLAIVLTANFNARFSDVNARLTDLRADMIERFRALEKLVDDRFESLERELHSHRHEDAQ
jgi:hypothetical protein